MTLKFSHVKSAGEFYAQLRRQATLDEFGDNLDALHDFLTTDLRGPATIEWRTAGNDASDNVLGVFGFVVRSAAKERTDLKINLG